VYPTNGVLKWQMIMDARCIYADPAIGPDGTVYVPNVDTVAGSDYQNVTKLVAFDPTVVTTNDPSGYPYPWWPDFAKWYASGIFSTPVFGFDGTIYAAGSRGFYALYPTNGEVAWTFSFASTIGGAPALYFNGTNETIILASGNAVIALTNAPGITNYYYNTDLYPYAMTNVQIRWFYTNNAARGFNYASPVVASDGTVYVNSSDGTITALKGADGTLKWVSPQIIDAGYPSSSSNGSGPSIGPDGTIYYCTTLAACALDPTTGSNKWVILAPIVGGFYIGGEFLDSIVVGYNNRVYVKYDGLYPFGSATNQLWCLNGADGTTNWTAPLSLQSENSNGQGAIALAADGEIYVGDADGTLYSFCPNGELNWSYPTYNGTLTSPMIGTDGTVYVAACSRHSSPFLYAFQGPAPADCQGWPEDRKNNRRNASITPASLSIAHLSNPVTQTNGFSFTVNPPMGPTGVLSNDLACVCGSTNLIQWGEVGEVTLMNGPTNFIDMTASNYLYRFYYALPQ
jgi:outer membrane protein assembly factor BamB